MSDAIPDTRNKRGRPKVGATQVQVRVPPHLLQAIDKLAAEHPTSTRPEMIRMVLQYWLHEHGYLKTD